MKKYLCALLLAVCLPLSGCHSLPAPREMENMALLRTMGVDRAGQELLVTVSTGPQVQGAKEEEKPAEVLSAKEKSLSGAVTTLRGVGESDLFFGYVDQLLLGEELARQGIGAVMDYFSRDVELSLGTQVWLIRDGTGELAIAGGAQGMERRLDTLCAGGKLGVTAMPRTVGEIWADLLEWGGSYAPALIAAEQEEGRLLDGGYAIFKEERLVGFLDSEEARGLELLAEKPAGHVIVVELPDRQVTVRISGSTVACRLSQEGRLQLDCRVTARLEEYGVPLTTEERGLIRKTVEEREGYRARSALDRLRAWEADCLSLGPRAGISAPGQWSVLEKDWPKAFRAQEPELTLRVALRD